MAIDLRDFVQRHGGTLYAGGRAAVVPGPGHSARDRSLSLRLSEDGGRVLFHSFAGDAAGEVMAHLGLEPGAGHGGGRGGRRGGGRAERARERAQERAQAGRLRAAEARARARRDAALCQAIWSEAGPIEGTPAETYLWRRGLVLEGVADVAFHPAAPRSKDALGAGTGEAPAGPAPDCPAPASPAPAPTEPAPSGPAPTCPAMVCLVRGADGAARALHLTYLTTKGGKAFGARSRLMFGPAAGGAVRLELMGTDGALAVAEGVETAAAYAALSGRPTWAALSTSGLRGFRPPPGLRGLWIAADHDASGAGLAAATALAQALQARCRVEIVLPPVGKDWNDALLAGVPPIGPAQIGPAQMDAAPMEGR